MACLKEERSRKMNRIKKKNDFFKLLLAEMWFKYLQG
jgi:flagellar hook assembly protein FlgD